MPSGRGDPQDAARHARRARHVRQCRCLEVIGQTRQPLCLAARRDRSGSGLAGQETGVGDVAPASPELKRRQGVLPHRSPDTTWGPLRAQALGGDRWGCPRPGGAMAILHKCAMMGISFGSHAQLALGGRNRPGAMPTGGTSGSLAAKRSNAAPLAFAAGGAARCRSACPGSPPRLARCAPVRPGNPAVRPTLGYERASAASVVGVHDFLAGLRHSGRRCGSRPQ
jgi:hypothetical protein